VRDAYLDLLRETTIADLAAGAAIDTNRTPKVPWQQEGSACQEIVSIDNRQIGTVPCGKCSDLAEKRGEIEQVVRDSAYHVIDYMGSTHFAVGLALAPMVGRRSQRDSERTPTEQDA